MSTSRSGPLLTWVIVGVVAVLAVGAGLYVTSSADKVETQDGAGAASASAAAAAETGAPALPAGLTEMTLGAPDAPVTVVEFASMTCSHCRHFHEEIMPALKERYIDTGKVRWVLRDYPLDGLALRASALARCAGEDQYFAYIGVLFRQQMQWIQAEDRVAALQKIAKTAGMSEAEFDSCMNDRSLMQKLVTARNEAGEELGVNSTPSFLVGGKLHAGALPVADFAPILDAALRQSGGAGAR